MGIYNQEKLINTRTNIEISIDNYQQQIDKLKLGEKEVEKLKKKIAKQEKKLKELENMIWLYKVGDVVLFKDDLREVKITKLVNFINNGERHIYIGDFEKGSINVSFTQNELIKKPYFVQDYVVLLKEKISELKSVIRQRNF
jgi:hypothetical protein